MSFVSVVQFSLEKEQKHNSKGKDIGSCLMSKFCGASGFTESNAFKKKKKKTLFWSLSLQHTLPLMGYLRLVVRSSCTFQNRKLVLKCCKSVDSTEGIL